MLYVLTTDGRKLMLTLHVQYIQEYKDQDRQIGFLVCQRTDMRLMGEADVYIVPQEAGSG